MDNLPVLRDAIVSLETRVNGMPMQAPTEVSWEEVSERVASEVVRASEEWINERMVSEVERVIQTQSNPSPVPSGDRARASQEDLRRLESQTEAGFKAFSKEDTDLKAWINAALSDAQHTAHADRKEFNDRMADTRSDSSQSRQGVISREAQQQAQGCLCHHQVWSPKILPQPENTSPAREKATWRCCHSAEPRSKDSVAPW